MCGQLQIGGYLAISNARCGTHTFSRGKKTARQIQLGICFLPNSRASIDHAPGPIIASVPPRTAKMIDIQAFPPPVKATQSSTAAISAPAMGVQKPAKINNPKTAPAICGAACMVSGTTLTSASTRQRRAVHVIDRCTRRPKPGQPLANVVKSRCKQTSHRRVRYLQRNENVRKSDPTILLLGD